MPIANCLIIANLDISRKVVELLEPDYSCRIHSDQVHTTVYADADIHCGIIHISNSNFQLVRSTVERIRSSHSFPLISVIQGLDLEVARLCGKIGIDRFIERNNLKNLKALVSDVAGRTQFRVTLADLVISTNTPFPLVDLALQYIEKEYVSIMSVSAIAAYTGVTESTLSRLFKRAGIPGPKKILMQFKLYHALKLMQTGHLSLTKIAGYAGFSNEKRLNECFHHCFHQSPRDYRRYASPFKNNN